jgi:two-component system cell cycle sensor histidine kinase/response regulator CckA
VVAVNGVLEGLSDMLRRLSGRRYAVELDLADDGTSVLIDPTQLEQVTMNLVANARDAMPDGGTIRVRTRIATLQAEAARQRAGAVAGAYVVLSVEDTGVGMEESTRLRLFEPFFTTKPAGKGTGLGLATVYGIVTQADGLLEVDSTAGQGSTFRVLLPLRAAVVEAGGEAAQPAPEVAEGRASVATILVADDQPEVTDLLEQILRNAGYAVLKAKDGEDAVTVARGFAGSLDLVLMDVVFPGLSGPDAVREIRSRRPETKALFMSSYADETVARHGLTDPGAPFLAKPFRPEALLRKVRELLAREAGRRSSASE